MAKPLALDLYSGAGGAAIGLKRAGFYVIGFDIKRPSAYAGDEFVKADVHDLPIKDIKKADFIWASPPCQAFSVMKNMRRDKTQNERYPNLIPYTRDLLSTHAYTAIENVPKAPIRPDVVLTGVSMGLPYIYRKRIFELSFLCLHPPPQRVKPEYWKQCKAISITNGSTSKTQHYRRVASGLPGKPTTEECKAVMGIPPKYVFTRREISEAIPPAYSEYIAKEALRQMRK